MAAPNDLTELSSFDANAISKALKERFDKLQIYTNVNTLLVAMNPFQEVRGLYSQEKVKLYANYSRTENAPHVYKVSSTAYRGLLEGRSQSVIVSGESGAGAQPRATGVASQGEGVGAVLNRGLCLAVQARRRRRR